MNTSSNPEKHPASASPRSRRTVLALTAAAAAAIGAGVAWRRLALDEPQDQGIWHHQFADLDDELITLADFKGQPLLLNFWATWCPPCVAEMPMLSDFHLRAQEKGWRMLGLAVDQPEPVRRFLQQTPVSYRIAIAGFAGVELTRQLGNTQGGLPFTVVFAADGSVQHRKLGQLSAADLQQWLA